MKYLITCFSILLSMNAMAEHSHGELEEDILRVYKNIKKYSDTGTSITEIISNGRSSITKTKFKTIYIKGEILKFTWVDMIDLGLIFDGNTSEELRKTLQDLESPKEYSFWKSSEGVFFKLDSMEPKKEENICLAIAGATGISHGIASNVPRFIVSEECLDDCSSIFPNAVEDSSVGEYRVIEVTYHTGNKEYLYINKDSGLLEKTKETRTLSSGAEVRQTIEYLDIVIEI